jgi:superfamily I DNA and/or RNA helicase
MVGDHHQLPPTLKADRNPFSFTGTISLLERQILAGTAHIQLREQFRMHPSISRIISLVSYDGSLRNNVITEQRPEVDQFKRFMRTIAVDSGLTSQQAGRLNTCSFILSPRPFTAKFPEFGSRAMPGSQSRYNFQTAMVVFRQVYWLIKLGGFKPQQILVTAFYVAQVGLLRAVFQDEDVFNGLQLGGPESLRAGTFQGREDMIQLVDCVTFGVGADEAMGLLGTDKRRFNVAMSRGNVGRIVICSQDFVKGKHHGGAWKEFLADPDTVMLGDKRFRTEWEDEGLLRKFEAVRKDWLKSD